MLSWSAPELPVVSVAGSAPVALSLYDHARDAIAPVTVPDDPGSTPVGMYVCGITPYDATHLGHAATYLTFDLIYRQLRDNGHTVNLCENVTDVDDPLFERAARDSVDWRELGDDQVALFRSDMEELGVIPPAFFVAVTDSIDDVTTMVRDLEAAGATYEIPVDGGGVDVYARVEATPHFGYESRCDHTTMLELFAERGGDPQRHDKRNPLDALVWRAHRDGEPSWPSPWGPGRPGWHIECAAIARRYLGPEFAIQGGGVDLTFPHHEFTAAHVEASTGVPRMAGHYVHTGMMGLDGVKMSKSLGNLVFVHKLTAQGHSAGAIRLAVFSHHYRQDRDFKDSDLQAAADRIALWSAACARATDETSAAAVITAVRTHLANDLDTVSALAAIDDWATQTTTCCDNTDARESNAGSLVAEAIHALLGVKL